MSKRSIDLCLVDPAKVAKLDPDTQRAIINFIQKAGVAIHIRNEFEQFIAFYHSLDCADLDEAAKFNFSDESIIHLPPLSESSDNDTFWIAVNKAQFRLSQQNKGISTFYGPDMLDSDFLDDHHHPHITFPIPYRDIIMFSTMVDAVVRKLKNSPLE
jgi:hypothetical protein